MSSNFYSQASNNFSSSEQGQVNPRTGLFELSFPLGTITGNNNLGPGFKLNLEYSPLSTEDEQGFGIGWSLPVSRYDQDNLLLILSSGEQYKTCESADKKTVTVEQKKLNSFTFNKISDNEYRLVYKSGQTEVLKLKDTNSTCFVAEQIISPAGHIISLDWQMYGKVLQLISVQDEHQILCKFDYSGSVIVDVWPDTSESYSIELTQSGGYVYSLTNKTANMTWTFDYVDFSDFKLIDHVLSPTGYIQQVTYVGNQMKFPSGGPTTGLPAVTEYRQRPRMGQPDMLVEYEYSTSSNYLGYGENISWEADTDNTYKIMGDYSYYSIERREVSGITLAIKRSYDSYHLMFEEVISQEECSRTTQIDYYADHSLTYEEQVAQYQLPKRQTRTWTDLSQPDGRQSRSEQTTTVFDGEGNLLAITTPDGIQTVYEYYPFSGETPQGDTGCPADPNGFCCFLKSKTVTPAASEFAQVPLQTILYAYQEINCPQGAALTSCILPVQETHLSDGVRLLAKYTEYETSTDHSEEFGRVKQRRSTLFGVTTSDNPNGDSVGSARMLDSSFAVVGEQLQQTLKFTGHDGLSMNVQRNQSTLSGRLLSTVDRNGNSCEYTYDVLGRILSRTRNKGLEYENTQRTDYVLHVDETGVVDELSATRIDASGNQDKTYYDGLGREIGRARSLGSDNAQWFDIFTQSYDEMGRVISETVSDFSRSDTELVSLEPMSSIQRTKTFDSWGKNSLSSYSDDHDEHVIYCPVTMQVTLQQATSVADSNLVLGQKLITYNLFQLPAQITRIDSQGMRFNVCYDYDGLGRVRKFTDELNQSTYFDYDEYGRLAKKTLPDGVAVVKNYSPHSTKPLISTISVNDSEKTYILGTREFDSLNRIGSSTCGGRTYQRNYSDESAKPSDIVDAGGQKVNYYYESQLKKSLTQVKNETTSNGLQQDFTFDKTTGRLNSAKDSVGGEYNISYTADGFLENEYIQLSSGTQRSSQRSYSLLGDIQSYVDISGVTQNYSYDIHGRVTNIEDQSVQAVFIYDVFSRIISQQILDKLSSKTLITDFIYDDFSREVQRDIRTTSTTLLSIVQSYAANDLLVTRETSDEQNLLRSEHFSYDTRNRLNDYTVVGSALPVDGYGQAFTHQHFTYDALGNITQCITTFQDGEDTAEFTYTNPDDPTQLSAVTHSHANYPAIISLSYDNNGRMVEDENQAIQTYDELGRLIMLSANGLKSTYEYDAFNRLVSQITQDQHHQLYYRQGHWTNSIELNDAVSSRLIKLDGSLMAIDDK